MMSDTSATRSPTARVAGLNYTSQDRHEPRGRKPNDQLPPSRAREVQRAFRLRRAEHLALLEERISTLEKENLQLRALLQIPEGARPKIGSGPTGRGKSVKEGGVPMVERVRARKEARARQALARGLPEPESSDGSDREDSARQTATLSPGTGIHASSSSNILPLPPLFGDPPTDHIATAYNYPLVIPFTLPSTPDNSFPDFTNLDASSLFKSGSSSTPGYSPLYSLFTADNSAHPGPELRSPSPPPTTTSSSTQPGLLERLKACCHMSDSHVVNDPGLLIFATRLCQSFPCAYSGHHPDIPAASDSDYLILEDSWRALKLQLDPGGEADGENRINTGRMASELVIRAAHSRGTGSWIVCRYREGMSVKRSLVVGLVTGLGGKMD